MDPQEYRRRRREHIRRHHPDRGGDPAQFIEGLLALEHERLRDNEPLTPSEGGSVTVFAFRTRRWPVRLWSTTVGTVRRRRRPARVH